jgi:POT family proton-dependent oligopeptide transporter
MSSGAALEIADAAAANFPSIAKGLKDPSIIEKPEPFTSTVPATDELVGPNGEEYPTEEEWVTLRRVYGKVDWVSISCQRTKCLHCAFLELALTRTFPDRR